MADTLLFDVGCLQTDHRTAGVQAYLQLSKKAFPACPCATFDFDEPVKSGHYVKTACIYKRDHCANACCMHSPALHTMSPAAKVRHQADIYKVNDEPRNLTPADLAFICQYTGKSSESIRPHILDVWRITKHQVGDFQ